jgi:hypothetical protein
MKVKGAQGMDEAIKLGVASMRALAFLAAKEDKSPDAPFGWHMPSQRTAAACRKTLEPKGLVAIERITPSHFRYRITSAGQIAIAAQRASQEDRDDD